MLNLIFYTYYLKYVADLLCWQWYKYVSSCMDSTDSDKNKNCHSKE